jgi:hypothetical protein
MRTQPRSPSEIAARQHGVITRTQLLESGLSRDLITRWTKAGRLHREFRAYTWRDVAEDPDPMLDELEELLVQRCRAA